MRTTNEIIVAGSLNPYKSVQDRVRVLARGGICQSLRATDYKDPPKILIEYEDKQSTTGWLSSQSDSQ